MANNKGKYRKGVGAVIINNDNKVFIAKRLGSNAWQMPQGGIEQQETPKEAFLRELKEETNISSIEILGNTEPLCYDIPASMRQGLWNDKYIGQIQVWFFAKFLGDDSEIDLTKYPPQEFDSYKWVESKELPEIIISFKKELYIKILNIGQNLKVL